MELLREIKRGALLRILTSILLAGLMLVTYVVGTFLAGIDGKKGRGIPDSAERETVSIVDNLYEPDAFSAYRDSLEGVSRVAHFYRELGELRSGQFLSYFDQSLMVAEFNGIEKFLYAPNLEEGDFQPYWDPVLNAESYSVKALELDAAAWEFYALEVAEGEEPEWGRIDYAGDSVSVILGDSYRGTYSLEDRFSVNFYGRKLDAHVSGFLRPNSYIYYKGDANYSLDDQIVVPYPSQVAEADIAGEYADFYRILLFAMASGDIALDEGVSMSSLADELAEVARATGYESYTILGFSDYLTQFRLVKNLIDQNRTLVLMLLAAITVVVALVIVWTGRALGDRRAPWITAMWVAGYPRRRLMAVVALGSLAYYFLALVLFGYGFHGLVGHRLGALVFTGTMFAVVAAIDLFLTLKRIHTTVARSCMTEM